MRADDVVDSLAELGPGRDPADGLEQPVLPARVVVNPSYPAFLSLSGIQPCSDRVPERLRLLDAEFATLLVPDGASASAIPSLAHSSSLRSDCAAGRRRP